MDELKGRVLGLLDEIYALGVEEGKKQGAPEGSVSETPVVDVEAVKAEERTRVLSGLKALLEVENADLVAKIEGLLV